MLNPLVNGQFQGLFKAYVLFKANLIFKDFQDSSVYSSNFQARGNPVICNDMFSKNLFGNMMILKLTRGKCFVGLYGAFYVCTEKEQLSLRKGLKQNNASFGIVIA